MDGPAPISRAELERLYGAFGPRLLLYLERRTGDPAVAADLLQEVFVRLLEKPIQAASDAEVRAYLYRTAQSRWIDRVRRAKLERLWSLEFLREPSVEAVEAGSDVERVYRTLQPRDALMLWLAYVEQMNHNEIAEALNVRPSSMKVLLHRARSRLREKLTAEGLAPEGSR